MYKTKKTHKYTDEHHQRDGSFVFTYKYKEPINNIKMHFVVDDVKLDLLLLRRPLIYSKLLEAEQSYSS